MTGILPIKKYGQHSALNLFAEYSMDDSPHAGAENDMRTLRSKDDVYVLLVHLGYLGYDLVVCMKERVGVIDEKSLYVPAWAV